MVVLSMLKKEIYVTGPGTLSEAQEAPRITTTVRKMPPRDGAAYPGSQCCYNIL